MKNNWLLIVSILCFVIGSIGQSCVQSNTQKFQTFKGSTNAQYIGMVNYQELYIITIDSTDFLLSTNTSGGESSLVQIKK